MNRKIKFIGSQNLVKHVGSIALLAIATTVSFSDYAWGKDPFRNEDARDIGKYTEQAFETVFLEGDYKTVNESLAKAEAKEPDEPLVHAMLASLAYTENDWESIKEYATKTLETARLLSQTDPLRGNLYLAVGHFLDGAYIYEKEGAIDAIEKLQLVFKFLDRAEAADPNDPELNLIKGYMDLFLAVNLPFSKPEQAIARFEGYAAPNYLVERGLAVAYRDLERYQEALKYADRALETAPENPEHYYLKGQILRQIGKRENNIRVLNQAVENFEIALASSAQLPNFVLKTLEKENRLTKERIAKIESSAED